MVPDSSSLPFDPDSERLPDGLSIPPRDGGEVILLLAEPAARESGWAPRAAVALARRWAAKERRIFLMDGDPAEPALHALVGEENGEGVTDAVLYGVSPSRIAKPLGDHLLFAPAGTVAADPASVHRHPRWSAVLAACREAGSVVVLYLPAGAPGVDHLAGEGDRVVRLAAGPPAAAPGPEAQAETDPGTVVLHPDPSTAPTPGAPALGAGATPAPAGSAAAGGGGAATAPAAATASDAPAGSDRQWRGAAGPKGSTAPGPAGASDFGPRPVKRRTSAWILLIVLLLIGGVVAAAWLGYLDIPGITRPPTAALLPSIAPDPVLDAPTLRT